MDLLFLKKTLLRLQNFKSEIDESFLPKISTSTVKNQRFDIVVVTASIDEYHSFSKYLERTEIKEFSNDPKLYLKGYITNNVGEILSIIMPIPSEMGIASASIDTTKSIINFSPRHIFMVGICAGIKSISNVGDIVVAEKTIDYNEVVEIENGDQTVRMKFMNNVLGISSTIKSKCQLFINQFKFPYEDIQANYNYSAKLKCHIGLMATGSSLLRNSEKVKQLNKDYHNLKGVDMETYGVYKAIDSFENKSGEIQFLSVKSVSDYADNDKPKPSEQNVDRRKVALNNSSAFLYNFIKSFVKQL